MAHTRHQTVTRVAPKAGNRSGAKNSNLKQAAHKGKAPVKDAQNAQSGYTAVPASVATLPPGEGPPMSSTSPPAGRGSKRSAAKSTRKNSTSTGSTAATASSSQNGSAQTTQPAAKVVPQKGKKGGAGTKRRHKARR